MLTVEDMECVSKMLDLEPNKPDSTVVEDNCWIEDEFEAEDTEM